jgi:hypothetical protein
MTSYVTNVFKVACIAYYFYFVFAFAVYSRITEEAPSSMLWPTTIVCDRQVGIRNCAGPLNWNGRIPKLSTVC